jgi:hypothetical protein
MIERLGQYGDAVYYLSILPSLSAPLDHVPAHDFFRLIVVLNQSQIPDGNTLGLFVTNALAAGARSVLCAGTASKLVHDLFDEAIEQESRHSLIHVDSGQFIPTSWHTQEPLAAVMWQALGLGFGCDDFEEDNPAIVALVLTGDSRIPHLLEIGRAMPESLDRSAESV